MKTRKAIGPMITGLCVLLASVSLLAGCKTWNYSIHYEGLYALDRYPSNVPTGEVDVNALRLHFEKHTFGPGQKPAILIVGYASLGKSKLGVLDLATGKTIAEKSLRFDLDYAALQPLNFSKPGNYEIFINNPHKASYDISITDTNKTFGNTNTLQISPLWQPCIRLDLNPKKSWKNYDRAFIAGTMQRWYDLLGKIPPSTNTGSVVLGFTMKSNGNISDMHVVTNTVSAPLADLCQKAILDAAPYPSWPPAMRKHEKDPRQVEFTFRYR